MTGPGHALGPNEDLRQCHHATYHEVQRLLPEAELIPSAFPGWESRDRRDADRRGDTFQFPSDAFSQELRAQSTHTLSRTGTELGTHDLIHHTDQSEKITSSGPFRIDYRHPPNYITIFCPDQHVARFDSAYMYTCQSWTPLYCAR